MIKAFARWLYMKTHRQELIGLARFARSAATDTRFNQMRADGICLALQELDLLEGQ